MNFADVMKNKAEIKYTENGAIAYDRLNGSLVTLFAQIGALRPRSEKEIEAKFASAFNEDRLLATKMLFYAGNIRGGLGERRTFRICLHWLAMNHPTIVKKNIQNIALFNRFDSLFALVGTSCEKEMWSYVQKILVNDLQNIRDGKPCSLLAKWMPTETASSKKTRTLARKAIHAFKITERQYRQILSSLRKYIKVVERKMSNNEWDDINYPTVPSYAMSRYSQAFLKHDNERYSKYIEDLNDGKTKVNASTLYPYDLVRNYMGWSSQNNLVAEQQWKALPNYISSENNIIVMADVSGSMSGRPMETSIGLAIYFAERNKGDYQNCYMTFTDRPHFIKINPNDTLREKVAQVKRTDIGYNTNLEAAFNYILSNATYNNVSNEDMPKALVVISDMEIDRYMSGRGLGFVETMKNKYAQFGYELPKLIFWNVEARNDTFLSQSEDVINISGQSASIFKTFIGALNGKTGWDIMIETLNDKMYDCVQI